MYSLIMTCMFVLVQVSIVYGQIDPPGCACLQSQPETVEPGVIWNTRDASDQQVSCRFDTSENQNPQKRPASSDNWIDVDRNPCDPVPPASIPWLLILLILGVVAYLIFY